MFETIDSLFIEKSFKRELVIVKILIERNTWVSFKELSEINNVVWKTTIRDLENINKTIPRFLEIKDKAKEVRFSNTGEYCYIDIYSIYLKMSFSYQLFCLLFRNKDINLFKLCDELFISQSHFYKKYHQLKAILPDGINIDLNSLKVIGDEFKIRKFYYNLLIISNNPDDLNISSNFLEYLEAISMDVFYEAGIISKSQNKENYLYWLAICHRRSKVQKVNINLKENYTSQFLKKIYAKIPGQFGNQLLDEYIIHSYGFYMQDLIYKEDRVKSVIDFYTKKKYSPYLNYLKPFFNNKNKQLGLDLIHACVSLPLSTDFFIKNRIFDCFYKDEIKKHLLETIYNKVIKNNNIIIDYEKKEILEILKFMVFKYHIQLSSNLFKFKRTSIIVSMSGGSNAEKYIKNLIEINYKGLVEFWDYSDFKLLEHVDIVITDIIGSQRATNFIKCEFPIVLDYFKTLNSLIERKILENIKAKKE
ncbi:helix-turn-helix domain-containing protein [Enterococcus hirae]|nr:helix-turn-helix domain-containing protein [Enterococcus hirae]